ncbi:MAG: hypothetical protein A3J52_03065 [Omnitrophica bacterium RIFCSPHIGHO2_02_FULL_49_9]|nr:MAG: hypothetical protein A3J52_03065 [Omnitrophica bacterium RIFCSPHIGHO2_02_FULL_49_9]
MKPFLGLDFGTKRVGVAKSDELHLLAHPMGFIKRQSDDQVAMEVSRLVREHEVAKIVVGMPKTMKGELKEKAGEVSAFIIRLKQATGCDVVTWDERLTTVQAEKALIAQDVSRSKRRVKQDAIAAEIMLQSYLDFLKGAGRNQ